MSFRPFMISACNYVVVKVMSCSMQGVVNSPQGGVRSTQDAVSSIQGPSAHRTVVSSMQGAVFSWVEATMVRLYDVGMSGRVWHFLANILCGTLSQVRTLILPPSLGSTRASHRTECFLLQSSTCLSTPLRHLSEASFLLSSWSLQMPSAILVIFTETRWFPCLSHKSICRQVSMHVTLGAFARASLSVLALLSQPS